MTETEPVFVDTNILVYAHKSDEGERHTVARRLLEQGTNGEIRLCISNQIMGEFCRVMRHKIKEPIPLKEITNMVEEIVGLDAWMKINYTHQTVKKALSLSPDIFIWDAVIAQTMLENGITKIYTENTKDFENIKGIKAINPFK